VAIALLNRADQETTIVANWKELGVPTGASLALRDLWEHKSLGTFKESISMKVGPHATVLLRATSSTGTAGMSQKGDALLGSLPPSADAKVR
jgi:alpha-galactosidase